MKTTKTPTPQRVGTATKFEHAEDLARWIVTELAGDPKALRKVMRAIELEAARSTGR